MESTHPTRRQDTTIKTGSSATLLVMTAYQPNSGRSSKGTITILLITATNTVLVSPGFCFAPLETDFLKGLIRERRVDLAAGMEVDAEEA
jgi:hypothetical protein